MSARSLKFILSLGGVVVLGSVAASSAMAGGTGLVSGSSHLSAPLARAAGKKKNHPLSADFKTPLQNVALPFGLPPNTIEIVDDGTLTGRPFGRRKPSVSEDGFLTYNQSDPIGTGDFSGRYHINFTALILTRPVSQFRGFYDYSVDANGNPSTAITGVITGGRGMFKGAKGTFQVLDRVVTNPENSAYRSHWQGSIRY